MPPYNWAIVVLLTFLLIALAKSWSTMGASHQPTFMDSCLTISHMCLSFYLVEELVLVFCVPL